VDDEDSYWDNDDMLEDDDEDDVGELSNTLFSGDDDQTDIICSSTAPVSSSVFVSESGAVTKGVQFDVNHDNERPSQTHARPHVTTIRDRKQTVFGKKFEGRHIVVTVERILGKTIPLATCSAWGKDRPTWCVRCYTHPVRKICNILVRDLSIIY